MQGRNVGVDIGYGFLKCRSANRHFILPSVVGSAHELAYQSELSAYTSPEDNLVVETDGQAYFVGTLAARQSEVAARSLSEDRAGDPAARVLLRTALGLLTEEGTSEFRVVTGLPPLYFRAQREAMVGAVRGEHHVVLGGGPDPLDRRFAVSEVRVIPQPFGTLFDLLLDSGGNPRNLDLAEARLGICDIGFRTVDCVVADRLDYVDRHCFSTTTGLQAAYGLLAEALQREFGVAKSDVELDAVVRTGRLRTGGQVHDVSAMREQAFRIVADKVLTEIHSHWPVRDLDVVYVTGGGAEPLATHFLEALPVAAVADAPQEANVRGYWKLANKLFGGAEPVESPNGQVHHDSEPLAHSVPL